MTDAALAGATADGAKNGGSASGRTGRATAKLAVLWHRLPFTTTIVMAMLMLGAVTGTLWRAAQDHAAYPLVAYGLPSFEAGHWWTLLTGPFFAVVPLFYLPMVGSFAIFAGIAEWRLGSLRAMAITIGGQVASVLIALQFLALSRGFGWPWADRLATSMDVGFSGGALFAMAVASASLRAPWRLRVRAGLCVYACVAIIYVGTLADLVHFFALVLGLPLGRLLVGPHRSAEPGRPSLRERRLLAVSGLLLVTVAELVMYFVPGDGPFGSSADMSPSGLEVAVLCVVVLPVLNGLRKGSQFAWRCAIGLTLLAMAQVLVIGGLIAVARYIGGDLDAEAPSLSLVDNLLWTIEFVLLISARDAFRAPSRRRRKRLTRVGPGPAIARALLGHNGGSTLSWMTTWPQNSYFVTADGRSYLAYQRHAGAAIALGDPIAPDGQGARALIEFATMCEDTGLVPCVFSATDTTIEVTRELGWKHVQVAEDTLIDLECLEFRGKAWQDVRTALNRAKKDGIEFRLVRLAEQPAPIVEQVRALSEEWISDKGMPEMGFTLGGVDEAMDPATRVGLAVDADGVVHGVTSWLPVHIGGGQIGGWTLDVMRRRGDGFRPVMEFLIASACLAFREEGVRFVSLSGAPLAHSSRSGRAQVVDRALETLGALMEPYYGFRSLHAFKAKFQPRHEPLYLTFRDEADLPRIGLALQRAYLPNTGLLELARMARSGKR
ncbi:bifunctional lysylphosphatidylglycerol flippase/synthetase MprF [Amycolatopsis samaneae]|uniref:Bifunctional lysylphosphatidylglycerol flippase/synthetase MprF n=1 Tax=Amycolatopsis samaneae TaxID=664691 RepID=A0ABW5GBV1_9PSEU